MRLSFRPLPVLTLVSLVAFGLLMWLGVWQVNRLHWKLDLIAAAERASEASPVPIQAALSKDTVQEYQRVSAEGEFDNTREVYLFTSKDNLGVGYQVITPFHLTSGDWILVDRGFVPEDKRDPKARMGGQIEGRAEIVGLIRHSVAPGMFTPAPDLKSHIWYSRDLEGMARALDLTEVAPVFIDADATANEGGYPLGGQTILTFTNNHFGYALTWFGMALALLVIYFVYHHRVGRLTFKE